MSNHHFVHHVLKPAARPPISRAASALLPDQKHLIGLLHHSLHIRFKHSDRVLRVSRRDESRLLDFPGMFEQDFLKVVVDPFLDNDILIVVLLEG